VSGLRIRADRGPVSQPGPPDRLPQITFHRIQYADCDC
jgi:hypothetical protein